MSKCRLHSAPFAAAASSTTRGLFRVQGLGFRIQGLEFSLLGYLEVQGNYNDPTLSKTSNLSAILLGEL